MTTNLRVRTWRGLNTLPGIGSSSDMMRLCRASFRAIFVLNEPKNRSNYLI